MDQIVMACIVDCLLELLYYGEQMSSARALLIRSGMQELFLHSTPLIPAHAITRQWGYDGADLEDLLWTASNVIGQSLDSLLQEKSRKRAKEILVWRQELERVLPSSPAGTPILAQGMLIQFFCRYGLGVLAEDIARKFTRIARRQLKIAVTGSAILSMLKLESADDILAFLQQEEFLDASMNVKIEIEDREISAAQLGARSATEADKGHRTFPAYFIFPALVLL
jgi:hypothetical protein